LERCQPVYEELPGWQAPTTDIRDFDKLPLKARQYVDRLEELTRTPVNLVCVGPEREQTIERRPIL
jgi:adenylosuccinate synthase